jgi:hypothetical protein
MLTVRLSAKIRNASESKVMLEEETSRSLELGTSYIASHRCLKKQRANER